MNKNIIVSAVLISGIVGLFIYNNYFNHIQKDFSNYAYFSCQNGINYKYYKNATDTGVTYYDDYGNVLAECAAWFGGENCDETRKLAGSCVEEFE